MTSLTTSTLAFHERSLEQMAGLRNALARLQNQVATGQRLERGSDDPAAASRLRALMRSERLGEVEAENAVKLEQDLSVGADEIGRIAEILIRARELAVQAASDTQGPEARAIIAEELEQLNEELFTRANAVTLTGEPLFAGTAGGPAYTRDASGVVSYAGNLDQGTVPAGPGIEVARGVAGPQVFEFELGGVPSSAFAVMGDLVTALRTPGGNPAVAAASALDGIDAAITTATRSQTVLGTRIAWTQALQDNQVDRSVALAQQRAAIGETDIAEAITRLQQTLTALEASQATFARISSLSLFNAL